MLSTATSTELFTIGYEGLDISTFVSRLERHRIRALIDVRKNAISRKKGFSKRAISTALYDAGIYYIHIPELGIPTEQRKILKTNDITTYQKLFQRYEEEILPNESEALDRLRNLLHEHSRVALMCFEANHEFCHRSRVSEAIQRQSANGVIVEHV